MIIPAPPKTWIPEIREITLDTKWGKVIVEVPDWSSWNRAFIFRQGALKS